MIFLVSPRTFCITCYKFDWSFFILSDVDVSKLKFSIHIGSNISWERLKIGIFPKYFSLRITRKNAVKIIRILHLYIIRFCSARIFKACLISYTLGLQVYSGIKHVYREYFHTVRIRRAYRLKKAKKFMWQ